MSHCHAFDESQLHAFTESRLHARNRGTVCELQIHAVQTISGWLPFGYGGLECELLNDDCEESEARVIYMTRTALMEWNLHPDCSAEFGELSVTEVTKKHRKFDDAGGTYYRQITINGGGEFAGVALEEELLDTGIQENYYNPAIYLEDQNDDGSPNPGNWGLNPDQDYIVWTGVGPFTDSRTQTVIGYNADAGRCGEEGVTHTDVVYTQELDPIPEQPTQYEVKTSTTLNADDEETSRLTETLSDPWYKTNDPAGLSWYQYALLLLSKVSLGDAGRVFSLLDSGPPRVDQRFGCDLEAEPPDVNAITLYWRRGEPVIEEEIGGEGGETIGGEGGGEPIGGEGGAPGGGDAFGAKSEGATAWEQPAYLMLQDWTSGSCEVFISSILAKKSRIFEPECLVFQPVVCDGLGGFDTPAGLRTCILDGPLSGFHDILPYTSYVGPSGPNGVTHTDLCEVCDTAGLAGEGAGEPIGGEGGETIVGE